jgi:hypothetical protein
VDVRGAGFHRLLDQLVDQANDRGLAGQILEVLDVVLGDLPQVGVQVVALVLGLGFVEAIQGGVDLAGQRHALQQGLAGGQSHHLHDEAVGRVGEGDFEPVLLLAQGQHLAVLQEAQTQGLAGHRLGGEGLRLRQFQTQDLGHGLGHVALGDQAETHQHPDQGIGPFLPQALGAIQVILTKPSRGLEVVDDALGGGWRGRLGGALRRRAQGKHLRGGRPHLLPGGRGLSGLGANAARQPGTELTQGAQDRGVKHVRQSPAAVRPGSLRG